jgi:hypothetical protein
MKNSINTRRYEELLAEAKTKVEGFLVSTADEYIPKLYQALRNENRDLSAQEARNRIQNDCAGIWARRTIRHALPDEAKDRKKQKAGYLRQKKAKSAAFSAADLSYAKDMQVIISNSGRTMEDHRPTMDASLIDTTREDKSTQQDNDLLQFEFSLLSKDVMRSILLRVVEKATKEDMIWFNGILDKHTGEVISANMGRIPERQKEIRIPNNTS